jgi:hypothetical protein
MTTSTPMALAEAIAASYEGSGSKKLANPQTWWPEAKAAATAVPGIVANELDRLAYALERRSDNVPLSDDVRSKEKVAVLRETADRIRMRAAELRAES